MRFVGRLSLLVVLPVLGLVALATYLTVYFSNASGIAYERVVRVNDEIETVQGLFSDLQDAETGVRGYVITQNPVYLEPYNQALTRVPGRLEQLSRLGDPEQVQRAAALRPVVTERLRVLDIAVEGMVRGDREVVVQSIASGRGKALMDEIRRQITEIVAAERRLLEQGHAQSRESDRFTLYTAVGGSLVALIALVVGTIVLLANNWRLQRTEGQLLRQSRILQNTLDNIRHGIAHFDAKGRLAAFNRSFLTKLEFPSDMARSNASIEEFKRVERERGTEVLSAVQEGGAAATPLVFRMSGHEYEIYRTSTPDGGFVISCVDVTARTRAEEMFRHTQKMESLGQLTGGVAHDFNNLLQIIASNIDLVRASPQEPRNKQRLDLALSGAERGARLTRQLLAFARRQPLEPRPTNLGRLVSDLTELVRRSLGEAIEVETIVTGGLWNAMTDQGQMENAILNLAINGRDAMPEGGKLTIELANAFLDESYAAAHTEVSPGQYVMLAVSDTGVGMPPDIAARAFEPFFSTKPEGQGTGLGLSQVYGFAKQSGGDVRVESVIGKGTTFTLYLPRVAPATEKALSENAGEEDQRLERSCILVVEDNKEVGEFATQLLAELGHETRLASTASHALRILEEDADRFDLVFTDVVMPGMSGIDLGLEIRRRWPGLRVVLTSGYSHVLAQEGRHGFELLHKPYAVESLVRVLRRPAALARQF